MATVGIKQLKNNLSSYIKKVSHGESVTVTERKKPVAYLIPIEQDEAMGDVQSLIREGAVVWGGGKPKGNQEYSVITGGRVMSNTIDVHNLPKEQVNLVEELVWFLREKLEDRQYEKRQKITVRSAKAETFLKFAGLVSVGGDAVKEAEYYDE